MNRIRYSNGVPYLLDACEAPPPEAAATRHPWRAGLVFALAFLVLQTLWSQTKDTALERLWIDTATVKTAVALIGFVSPGIGVVAQGSRIKAPGGGINVLNGCEGTDILFLLAAAFLAFPMPWRRRLAGLGLGLVLVFLLNEARILALFYAYRNDRALFDLLHSLVAPIVLIAFAGAYFYAWAHRERLAEAA
jgi:exosortase family protein XrtM